MLNIIQKMTSRNTKDHAEINKAYKNYVKMIEKDLGKNTATNGLELLTLGRKYIGKNFRGVYAQDAIDKKIKKPNSYAIINTDTIKGPGVHWIGLYTRNGKKFYVYDSFGSPTTKILPHLSRFIGGKHIDTDNDKEQKIKETNCGQRSLGFLLAIKNHGIRKALLI